MEISMETLYVDTGAWRVNPGQKCSELVLELVETVSSAYYLCLAHLNTFLSSMFLTCPIGKCWFFGEIQITEGL